MEQTSPGGHNSVPGRKNDDWGVAEAPATHIWGWAWEAKLSPCLLYIPSITTEKKELWHEKRRGGVWKLKSTLQGFFHVGSSCTNRMPHPSRPTVLSESARGSVAQGKALELWGQVPLDFIGLRRFGVILDKSISLDFTFYLCKIKLSIFPDLS